MNFKSYMNKDFKELKENVTLLVINNVSDSFGENT